MKYYNLEDPFVSTNVNRALPLLFAPLFQSLKRYTYHFLSLINQRCQILISLYSNFIYTFSSIVQGKKKSYFTNEVRSLTTVICELASKRVVKIQVEKRLCDT